MHAHVAGAPLFKSFTSRLGHHVLVVPYSRIFDAAESTIAALRAGDSAAVEWLEEAAGALPGEAPLDVVPRVAPQSVSLNVSSHCNLACSYCYAGRGGFAGAQPSAMTWETARAAVDRLLAVADATAPITVGFLGGEPFANRPLVHRVVAYATDAARQRHLDLRFSFTTNGTLLLEEDVSLLREHRCAVTVSIDGGETIQNRQRPLAGGGGSFAALATGVGALLRSPGRARVAARATVTRHALDLEQRFDQLIALGFPEAGFSPLRQAVDLAGPLRGVDWQRYLTSCVGLARAELSRALDGRPIRFTNFAVALKQLHRGWSSPYPCGAGGGYFSVGADGDWYACHRAIGDDAYRLGRSSGLNEARRDAFLRARHVHQQEPCRSCWARYLCSGGCHQEAAERAQASCDFIRGWLEACLRAYCELSAARPAWFSEEVCHE
jgi:uncharacterized protein